MAFSALAVAAGQRREVGARAGSRRAGRRARAPAAGRRRRPARSAGDAASATTEVVNRWSGPSASQRGDGGEQLHRRGRRDRAGAVPVDHAAVRSIARRRRRRAARASWPAQQRRQRRAVPRRGSTAASSRGARRDRRRPDGPPAASGPGGGSTCGRLGDRGRAGRGRTSGRRGRSWYDAAGRDQRPGPASAGAPPAQPTRAGGRGRGLRHLRAPRAPLDCAFCAVRAGD